MFQFGRKKIEERQLKQYKKCSEDVVYFAEHFFNIHSMDHGLHIIKLYDFQIRVLKEFQSKEFSRNSILLAGRQASTSTLVGIYLLWYAMFHERKTIFVLSNKHYHRKHLHSIIKSAHDELPEWMKYGAQWSKDHILFSESKSTISFITSHDSLRGQSTSLLYREDHQDPYSIEDEHFFNSVMPTLLSGRSTEVIFTSYKSSDVYRKALAGENNFKPIKINWWEIPGRSESWKRDMIKHIGRDNFNKEFECLTTTQT
jgi:hypothetical protein